MITIAFNPIIAQIGPFQLAWHGLFTALAIAVAVWLGIRLAERRGMPADPLANIAFWGVVGGLIGARLFHVFDHLPMYLANPGLIFAVWEGGVAAYGGFIGGIIGGLAVARYYRLSLWPLLDAVGPALLIGQAIGRIGCLMNGDAWGAPTGESWGLVYTHPNALLPANLHGVPTHPYPLYEIAAVLVALSVLRIVERRRPRSGVEFLVTVISYAVIRFGLSFFRQETIIGLGLQEAQIVAVLSVLVALVLVGIHWLRSPDSSKSFPAGQSV